MSDPAWLDAGRAHVWRPYCQHATAEDPLPVVGAKGCRLVLADGRELVDGTSSWWTAVHGYGHPVLVERIAAQARRLAHVAFGGLAHEAAYTLAARLTRMLPAPLTRVFFTESGSVAVEVALKMALQSFQNRGRPRRGVVCFQGAYHGDTFATMALSDPEDGMHRAFRGLGVRATHVPLPAEGDDSFEASLDAIGEDLACVVVEPLVQCAGGMRFHDAAALRRMRRACDRLGALLVFDEIATGFHRTGRRFTLDETQVVPDVVVVGKALTGGTLPLAATVASDAVFDAFLGEDPGLALQHGPTYMGNALACAAAHASLDLFESDDYCARARRLEGAMRDRLAPLRDRPGVRSVRCKGAIGVVETDPGAAPRSAVFAAKGAFLRPLRLRRSDVIYVMPPLVIGDAELDVLLGSVHASLDV